jgi:hypothetical protein
VTPPPPTKRSSQPMGTLPPPPTPGFCPLEFPGASKPFVNVSSSKRAEEQRAKKVRVTPQCTGMAEPQGGSKILFTAKELAQERFVLRMELL